MKNITIPNPSTDKGVYAFLAILTAYHVLLFITHENFVIPLLTIYAIFLILFPFIRINFRINFSTTHVDCEAVTNGYYSFKTNRLEWDSVKYLYVGNCYWKSGNYLKPLATILVSIIKTNTISYSPGYIKRSKQALIRLCEESVDDVLAIINERFGLSLTRDLMDFDKKAPARIIWCYTDASNNAQKALVK